MPTLNLPHGPWNRVFKSRFSKYTMAMFENPEREIMVAIYEGEKMTGALVIMSKVFLFKGEISFILAKIRSNAVIFEKKEKDYVGKYLIINSDPKFIRFEGDELSNEINELYSALSKGLEQVVELAKRNNVILEDINRLAKKGITVYEEPFFVTSYIAEAHQLPSAPKRVAEKKKESASTLFFGLNRFGSKVEIPLSSMSKTLISGGARKHRLHLVHVLVEELIMNGYQPVVFDLGSNFSTLSSPNPQKLGLFAEHFEPVGIPSFTRREGPDCFVDMGLVSKESLREILGLGKDPSSELVLDVLKKTKDLVYASNSLEYTKTNDFDTNRAIRFLTLVRKDYRDVLGKDTHPEPYLIEKRPKVVLVELTREASVRNGILNSIVSSVVDYFKEKKRTTKAYFVVVDAQDYLPEKPNAVQQETIGLLKELSEMKVGYCLVASTEQNINSVLVKKTYTKLYPINDREAIVKEDEKLPVRIAARPGLSMCGEELASAQREVAEESEKK